MIGIVADLGGEVEGHRQAGLTGFQEEVVTFVGLLGGGETGVLAHGPEAAAISGGLHRPGVRILTGQTQLLQVVESCHIQGGINPLEGNTRGVDKFRLALRHLLQRLGHLVIILGLGFLDAFQLFFVRHALSS